MIIVGNSISDTSIAIEKSRTNDAVVVAVLQSTISDTECLCIAFVTRRLYVQYGHEKPLIFEKFVYRMGKHRLSINLT